MESQSRKRIRFIINPISGTRDKDFIESYIYQYIDHNKFFFDIAYTEYAGHAIKLASEAAAKEFDAVVAIGGDGSVNEVAQGLVHSKTAMAIIPNGSGNGLAHYLKIPLNVEKAIGIINDFNVLPIDTAMLNNHLFVSIAGIGFDALVADDFSRAPVRGFVAYLAAILKNYPIYFRKKYIIYANGKKVKVKAMMISLANSDQFGYHSVIAPDAVINDGNLDVCIIKKIPLIEAGILSVLMFLKRIDFSKRIEIFRANRLTIIQNKNRPVHIDGDPRYPGKVLEIEVHHKSLYTVVPAKTFTQLTTKGQTVMPSEVSTDSK